MMDELIIQMLSEATPEELDEFVAKNTKATRKEWARHILQQIFSERQKQHEMHMKALSE